MCQSKSLSGKKTDRRREHNHGRKWRCQHKGTRWKEWCKETNPNSDPNLPHVSLYRLNKGSESARALRGSSHVYLEKTDTSQSPFKVQLQWRLRSIHSALAVKPVWWPVSALSPSPFKTTHLPPSSNSCQFLQTHPNQTSNRLRNFWLIWIWVKLLYHDCYVKRFNYGAQCFVSNYRP